MLSIAAAAAAIGKAVAVLLGLLRDLLGRKQREEDRQAGRDQVVAKTNAETLGTKNAMDDVPRPSDAAVSDSLRNGRF